MSNLNNGGMAHLTTWGEMDGSKWMAFNEACERARLSIGAEIEPEGDSGTSALLARARDGLIALNAKRTERIFERLGHSPEFRVFDQADGAILMELLFATYHSLPGQNGGEQWSAVYINYSAGDFKFEIESEKPPFRITYSAWGMVFSRRDVEASFPLSVQQAEESASDGNGASGVRLRKGRTKGTGFHKVDAPLLDEMAEAIAADSSLNATSAARRVADKAKGASYEAKVDRLSRKFRAGRNGE